MKLFLLRHSESVQENDATNDFNRTLSINGNNEANLLANFILRRKLNFNKVLLDNSTYSVTYLSWKSSKSIQNVKYVSNPIKND